MTTDDEEHKNLLASLDPREWKDLQDFASSRPGNQRDAQLAALADYAARYKLLKGCKPNFSAAARTIAARVKNKALRQADHSLRDFYLASGCDFLDQNTIRKSLSESWHARVANANAR